MDPGGWRQLPLPRLLAYLVWPGMQPSLFLLSRRPTSRDDVPTWNGNLINLVFAAALLWLVPRWLPVETPLLVRAWIGLIGELILVSFALFDAWVILYRAGGIGVEKLFVNPVAATSLMDFWGRRWN